MPSSADSRSTSVGKCLAASHSRAYGARRLAANAAAVSVITRSSSSRVKEAIAHPALIHSGNDEFGAVLDAGRPPLGHGLGLRVEEDRRGPVLVEVAEAGALPAPEGVVGHRYRDRHVDADHADLHA